MVESAPVAAAPAELDDDVTTLPELLSTSTGGLRGIPASDLARPAAAEYLKTITSLSLDALQAEPARIKDECTAIESELTNLCFREHRTFIEVHRCADDVQDALEEFGDSLDRLLAAVPPLESECEAFAQSTRGIQQARRRATLVLEHQDKLLDLLEIPQLMDTCVRNGYYQEAMELYAHANKLAKRYGDVPIVLSVQAEVASVMQLQFAQLLAVLREPVKLPTLVKAVGFLRRMGRLPEDELRIAFLESRDAHFQTQLTALERDRSDKVRYTRRYVDLFRENIYDAISQYGSIFLDPSLFVGAEAGASVAAMDILVIFCHRAIDDLMAVIDQSFPHIPDTSSLSSLLTQLGYCSLSFARVGLDFSSRLVKPFEKAVLDLTVKGFDEAAQALITTIKDASRLSRSPSTWMCASEHVAGITGSETSPPVFPPLDASVSVAPSFLTTYPPLAIYLNGALSTLNSLRLLAPLALQEPILQALDESLAQITAEIVAYARSTLHQTANAPTRPSGLRRNNSIGNQGISVEVRSERNTAAKRILCAFAAAFLAGAVPHLRRALVVGIYAEQPERLKGESTAPSYSRAIGELRAWVEENQTAEAVAEKAASFRASSAQPTETARQQDSEETEEAEAELAVPAAPDKAVSGIDHQQSPIEGRDSLDLSLSQVSEAIGYDVDSSAAGSAPPTAALEATPSRLAGESAETAGEDDHSVPPVPGPAAEPIEPSGQEAEEPQQAVVAVAAPADVDLQAAGSEASPAAGLAESTAEPEAEVQEASTPDHTASSTVEPASLVANSAGVSATPAAWQAPPESKAAPSTEEAENSALPHAKATPGIKAAEEHSTAEAESAPPQNTIELAIAASSTAAPVALAATDATDAPETNGAFNFATDRDAGPTDADAPEEDPQGLALPSEQHSTAASDNEQLPSGAQTPAEEAEDLEGRPAAPEETSVRPSAKTSGSRGKNKKKKKKK